ncbi:apolipoprotein O, a [Sinocyclocheilus grahami]|uniref:apolipoprotein O, a n=1 Tax=Sinocyclocheilus grahami TaxID=75366 RepID=UPI0007AD640A|nr:PREDICTED: MICOS complex subunit MIC26-like [Sinocyclocheilus grahami]
MYKVGGVAGVSGTLGLISASVLAAADDDDDKPGTALSVDELSLYTRPQQKIQRVQPERGQVEESVATLRKLAEPYATRCQQTASAAKQTVQVPMSTCTHRHYPRCSLPLSHIWLCLEYFSLSFLGIFFLSFQGSRLKKLIYPTGLMAVAASMYYPQEAVTVAKNTGDTVYDWALQAYVAVEKLIKGKPASKKDQAEKSSSGETKA